MENDESLLTAWKAGDRRAGSRLFERHFERVRRFFVNKARGDEEVSELTQRTFLRCIDASKRFEGRSSFRTFLFAIARNVLLEHYRERLRDQRCDGFGDVSLEDLGAGPSTLLREKQEQQLLLLALRRIPMKDQIILELYYWEHLTAVQIGEIMEIPENTARSRIRHGKQRLKEEIARAASEPGLAQRTADGLDRWAKEVRVGLG